MAKKNLLYQIFFPVLLIGLIVDQLSKRLIIQHTFEDFYDPTIGFVLHMNKNIAFSLPLPGAFASIFAFFVLSFCLYRWGGKYFKISRATYWMLALIFSGAVGNILDRIFYGAVVDFVKFYNFPIFNFADAFITSGVIVGIVWYRKIFR